MIEISKKTLWGGVVAAVLLVVIVVRSFSGGSPDVSSSDPSQRIAAIHQVTVNGSPDAGETLARVAANDSSPKVRREAMAGLSHFLKPAHREIIRKGTKDADAGVREIAADTLSAYAKKYSDKTATVELIEMTKGETEKDENVRKDRKSVV